MEFATEDGALASVTAANATGEDGGMLVGGRKLTLNLAMDRDQAKTVAKQMSKEQDDHDRRHLKLAKVFSLMSHQFYVKCFVLEKFHLLAWSPSSL